MIDLKTVEGIHHILIEKFGGSQGIRDHKSLEAAIARPYATFDGQELYPTAVEKATAIFESLIINHPFIDGNKRTSYFLLRLVLMMENFDIAASQDEKYQFVIASSKGELRSEGIKEWIFKYLVNNENTLGIP